LRFLGIFLGVLRLEVAVYNVYITNLKSKNSASEPVYIKEGDYRVDGKNRE
jgi:hypothetical protein